MARTNYITLAEFNAAKENASIEQVAEMRKRLLPVVGMGATKVLWSDLRAMTITKVCTPNKIEVMHNKVKCLDFFADDYEILDEIEPRMGTEVYTRRRSGRWVQEGYPDRRGEVVLMIDHQAHSIDPTF